MMLSGNNYSRSIVSLETNEFYLQFPFCQIGHLQWIRQPNFLAYNDDNTMVGYRASQAWWTITTEKFASSAVSTVPFFVAAVFYLVMNGVVTRCFTLAEKKFSYYR